MSDRMRFWATSAAGGMGFVYPCVGRAAASRSGDQAAARCVRTPCRACVSASCIEASEPLPRSIILIFAPYLTSASSRGEPYLVMELLLRRDAQGSHRLRAPCRSRLRRSLHLSKEVAEALGVGTRQGCNPSRHQTRQHLFTESTSQTGSVQAKVLDFGLAKFQGGVTQRRVHQPFARPHVCRGRYRRHTGLHVARAGAW